MTIICYILSYIPGFLPMMQWLGKDNLLVHSLGPFGNQRCWQILCGRRRITYLDIWGLVRECKSFFNRHIFGRHNSSLVTLASHAQFK